MAVRIRDGSRSNSSLCSYKVLVVRGRKDLWGRRLFKCKGKWKVMEMGLLEISYRLIMLLLWLIAIMMCPCFQIIVGSSRNNSLKAVEIFKRK